MTSSTQLAAQLCSRLCHDLLNPIGALGNGIELLANEDDPKRRAQYVSLLEDSVRASTNKLTFFRLAYGAANGLNDNLPSTEPHSLISALAADKRELEIEWFVADDALPKSAVQVLLNLAAIGMDALPRGGTLTVAAERSGKTTEVVLRAAGPRIALEESIGRALDGSLADNELSGQTAPAFLARQLVQKHGGNLQYASSDDMLVLGAVLNDDASDA